MSELGVQPLTVAYVTHVARLLQSKIHGLDLDAAEKWLATMLGFSPRMRAASLVNSTHIVRDGLAEGEPDWERAVDRYERAGRMGMVVAMFNAGNVAGWIANKGNKDYVARAAYWFQYALDYVSAGKVVLDFNGPDGDNGMDAVLNRCRLALAYIHVNANWPEADPEYGIKLITDLAVAGDEEARETFGKGMARRLLALQGPVSESPSENWRRVLKALNWDVTVGLGGENVSDDDLHVLLREKLGIEVFSVNLATQPGTYMPVVVTDDPYLPVAGGDEILPKLAEMLLKIFPRGCILFTRRAMFRQIDSRMFTRAFVVFSRAPHLREVAISLFGGGPESLLEQAGRGAACGSDSRFADANCAISIAVNTFDDGLSPAEGGRIDSAWIGVGNNWRMPVLRSHGEPADELLARVMEPRPVPRKSSAG